MNYRSLLPKIAGIGLGLALATPAAAQFSPSNDAQEQMGDATVAMCPSLGARRDAGITQSESEQQLNAFCDALVGGQYLQTNNVLQRVNGEELQNAQSQTTEIRSVQLGQITSRISALRASQPTQTGISTAGLNVRVGDEVLVGAAHDDRLDGGDDALLPTLDWQKLGIYVTGSIRFGDKDETSQAGGFSFDTKGLTIGADYRIDDDLLVGAALGYTHFDVDFDVTSNSLSGQDLGSDGVTLAFYGAYFPTARSFADVVLSLGWLSYDSRRRIVAIDNPNDDVDVEDIDAIAKGKFDSFYYGLAARTGYERRLIGRVQMAPWIQFDYVHAEIDGFSETSDDPRADAISLRFGSQEAESLRSSLGVELSRGFDTPIGPVIPRARAVYNHEFLGDDEGVLVRYKADPTRLSEFELRTEGRDRHYGELGASIDATDLPYGLTATIDYGTLVGLRDFEVHALNVRLNKTFLPY